MSIITEIYRYNSHHTTIPSYNSRSSAKLSSTSLSSGSLCASSCSFFSSAVRILEIQVSVLYGQLRDSAAYGDDEESLTCCVETRTKWYTTYAVQGEQDFTG